MSPTRDEIEVLVKRLLECGERIGKMCSEGRPPRMTIPAREDDDDLFISRTARAAADMLEALSQSGEQLGPAGALTEDLYQIVGSLAAAAGLFEHPEVVRVLDYLAYEDKRAEPLLPWPRTDLASTPDARREREKIVAWLRDTPYVNIATYSASDFANAIERGEHMEAADRTAPEHVSASATRKDAGAAASASLGASVEMRVAGEPLPAPPDGWSSVGPELLEAAKRVLAHLDFRIDLAPSSAKPVFDGIADLHDAIGRAEALARPAPKGEDGR